MSLICEICHEVPERPVISPVSGHIYERRLVEKYIEVNGTDPVNGEPLKVEQLIDVKATPQIKPRPLTATSIPALLKIFQDEWDAVMLHSFTLKQQLQITRQELSHTLHQHDSTCRMTSRLTQEVTAAREALATLKPHSVAVAAGGDHQGVAARATDEAAAVVEMMVVDESQEVTEITEDVIKKLQDNASMLTAERKRRGKTVPRSLIASEDVRRFHQVASHVGLHSASLPGILALDISQADSNRIVTGGVDKNAVVFNKSSESVVAILKGHSKKVTDVIYHPTEETVLTASMDQSIRVWGVQENAPCSHVIKPHNAPISGFSLHATGDYLLSSSLDGYWAFSDIRTGAVLCKVPANTTANQPLTCAKFHPDGLIFGTGTEDSEIKIWDLKEKSNVANFTGHQGPVTAMSFSENGFYLATAASDAVIKLWDLRKLKNFKNLTLDDNYEVKALSFDQSGTYLAVAGTDIRIYLCKQWQELAVLNNHTAVATGVAFGENASFVASSSMDRSLKIFSL